MNLKVWVISFLKGESLIYASPPPHFLIEMLRPPYLLYANEFEVSATFNMNGYRPMIRTNKNNIVGVRCAFYSEGVARLLTAE